MVAMVGMVAQVHESNLGHLRAEVDRFQIPQLHDLQGSGGQVLWLLSRKLLGRMAETDCVDCLRRKSCVTWSVFLWRCTGWLWDGWFSMLGWTMWTWSLKILLRNGAKQDTARGLTHAEKDQNWSDMDHPMWFLEVVAGFKHKRVNIHWTTVFEGNIYETLTAVSCLKTQQFVGGSIKFPLNKFSKHADRFNLGPNPWHVDSGIWQFTIPQYSS